MYADLEKIEARGKRKKDKSKGLFSSFGKKDEPEAENSAQENTEPVQAQPSEPPKQETVPAPKPMEAPKPVPVVEQPKPQPAPMPVAKPTETAPARKDSGWSPPTGSKLKKAEDDLLAYKRWLNSGFKSGVLTKQQCIDMVRTKEIELGLKPSE